MLRYFLTHRQDSILIIIASKLNYESEVFKINDLFYLEVDISFYNYHANYLKRWSNLLVYDDGDDLD